MISYQQKLSRVLDGMGGLYTLSDIEVAMHEGRMQGFVENNSWVVTEVQQFPRARKLHVLAMVGDLEDVPALQDRVLDYANDVNASLVSTFGRRGWFKTAERLGWRLKAKTYLYHRKV